MNAYFPQNMLIDSSHNVLLDTWYQYGVIPKTTSSLLVRASFSNVKGDTAQHSWRQLRVLYGVDGAFIVQKSSNNFKLIEGFGGLKYGPLELWYGRRLETTGFIGDTVLSSGSYSWSGNAPPFLKIQLAFSRRMVSSWAWVMRFGACITKPSGVIFKPTVLRGRRSSA